MSLQEFLAAYPIVMVLVYLGAYVCVFGGLFCLLEGWKFTDAVYYTMITGTTVGFGDLYPTTSLAKWAAFFFIPFAVVFVSTQLSSLATIILGKAEDSKLKVGPGLGRGILGRQCLLRGLVRPLCLIVTSLACPVCPVQSLLAVDLSLEALLNMDDDGDGEITEFEFIKFMMTTAGMADEGTLEALHKRFKEMDADGSGSLTKDDILFIIKEKEEAEKKAANDARITELRLS